MFAKQAGRIIGRLAVNHFTQNFDEQAFDGQPWADVKRRDPSSTWYGFKYGAHSKKPARHPSRKGVKRKYKARKDNPITNYSPTARQTPILSSQKSELENSITFVVKGTTVIIFSDKPYANVHNEGGQIKVFGRKTARMPMRKFIGQSTALDKKLHDAILKLTDLK
jgi:phage gpG-like protein